MQADDFGDKGLRYMGNAQKFKHVAVLLGGISAERDISLRSGAAAAAGLRACGYVVTEVDVQDARFVLPDGVEAVFLALHGAFGEDGTIQDQLDTQGIPFTGSGAAASRLAMDKPGAKMVWQENGIPTPPYCVVRAGETVDFGMPAVVKPAAQGSSIGVALVRECEALDAALRNAFVYDDRVLVETYIPGHELTVGILDGVPLPVVEIVAPDGWYGFGAKYTLGQTRYEVPAALRDGETRRLQELALSAFTTLGCVGFGRVDFRMASDGEPMVLEVNTIPGLTETSLFPKAASAAGISFPALCHRIMETAGLGSSRGVAHA